jgi:hypothetical protein
MFSYIQCLDQVSSLLVGLFYVFSNSCVIMFFPYLCIWLEMCLMIDANKPFTGKALNIIVKLEFI